MAQLAGLGEVLLAARSRHAGITVIGKKHDEYISYEQLYQDAVSVLAVLQERGMKPGDELLLQIEDERKFMTVFWAAVLGGFIAVPVTAGRSVELLSKLKSISGRMRNPYWVASAAMADGIVSSGDPDDADRGLPALRERLLYAEQLLSGEAKGIIHQSNRSDLAFIQYSSGSTGDPKGVMLTHENLLTNMEAILLASGATEADRSLSWMPLTHDMGLIGFHLSPMLGGMQQYIMPTAAFVQKPMLWLRKANEYRATCLASPNFGYKHLLTYFDPDGATDWDLSCVRTIFNGAEPISVPLCRQFLDALAPCGLRDTAMFPVYGMAEAGLAVTFPPPEERMRAVELTRESAVIGQNAQQYETEQRRSGDESDGSGITFVDVGYPVKDCEVRIASELDRPVNEGVIGQIQIRGANVTSGYYRDDAATREAYTADGWLRTGDIGFMQEGRLVVTGRMKDILFMNGQNVYPHDIEQIAATVPGLELGKVAACGVHDHATGTEQLLLFLLHRGRLDPFLPLAEQVGQTINRMTGYAALHVLPVKHIPKTTSGKIQRYKLTAQYERGEFISTIAELEAIRSASRLTSAEDEDGSEVEADPVVLAMLQLWAEAFKRPIDKMRSDDHFFEIGGNSLQAMMMLAQANRRFGVEATLQDLFAHPTPAAFAACIASKEEVLRFGLLRRHEEARAQEICPTTSAQRRIFVQQQARGIGTAYNVPNALRIDGEFDVERAAAALSRLVERHEPLRTCYEWHEGELMQRISKDAVLHVDYDEVPESEIELLHRRFVRPFELAAAPLFRSAIVKCGPKLHYLFTDTHHIACDGLSLLMLLSEWAQLYRGETLQPLTLQYRDYAWHERSLVQSERVAAQEAYWKEKLRGDLPLLQLPAARVRGTERSFEGSQVSITLPHETVVMLEQLAKRQSSTLYAALFTLYALMIARYANQDEVIIGALVAGRTHPDTAAMLGMFNNYLPVRFSMNSGGTFLACLAAMNGTLLEAFAHQEVPYERIVELSETRIDHARNPLFDTMVILHNQLDATAAISIDGAELRRLTFDTGTAKLDLKLDLFPEPNGGIACIFEYDRSQFDRTMIEMMASHYMTLANAALAEPDTDTGRLIMLTEREQRMLEAFNKTAAPYPDRKLIHTYVAEHARNGGLAPAIRFGEQSLSYGDLNARADRLARVLRSLGVGRDMVVGLLSERSLDMMVGLFAILKAGGAYLPLSPQLPEERIAYMLTDSNAALLLADEPSSLRSLPFEGDVICLRDAHDLGVEEGLFGGDLHEAADPDSLAYVIYTSGSTGRPKGVMVEHRALMNRLHWMQKQYPLGPQDVILQKTSILFDVSVWELLWWSMSGASVVLLEPGAEKDPIAVAQAIDAGKVTTIHYVPSMLSVFLQHAEKRTFDVRLLDSLKLVFASGEALQVQHVEQFRACMPQHCRLINLYGPTEAAIDVSYYECHSADGDKTVPIGKPIANIQLHVLSRDLQPQPIGVPGELYIGGAGLARGYANKPEMTNERFVPNPFMPGERLYRTGDLACWMAAGDLDYRGRVDHQVKIRGYRIELGEIERTLLRHEAVAEAVVTLQRDDAGDPYLAAYLVSNPAVDDTNWSAYLGNELPSYMIPQHFVSMSAMPLTSSGKVDRHALPAPIRHASASAEECVEPMTALERRLAEIWKTLLGVGQVGANSHFYALGGHSLKAAALIALIHKEFGIVVPLGEWMKLPTVKRLAELLASGEAEAAAPIEIVSARPHYPVSPAQRRLFILQQLDPQDTSYQLPVAFKLAGRLDCGRLEGAYRELIRRHEALRTSFKLVDGHPVQVVHEEVPFCLEELQSPEDVQPNAILAEYVRPFALAEAPLMRGAVMRMSKDEHLLLFDMHHLIADGLSAGIMAEELMRLYGGEQLVPLAVQYKDYAAWQLKRSASDTLLRQERYWLTELEGELPVLQLPTDYARPQVRSTRGDEVSLQLDAVLLASLRSLASAEETTLYCVLLSAYAAMLSQYANQDELIVGTPAAGRMHPDLEPLIGMFVGTLAIRVAVPGAESYQALLRQVSAAVTAALDHQEYPFEQLVEKLASRRDTSRHPIFDVMFVLQQPASREGIADGLHYEQLRLPTMGSKFDLTLEAIDNGDELRLRLEYSTALFKKDTISRLLAQLVSMLEAVVVQPEAAIAEIGTAMPADRRLLAQFNDTETGYPTGVTLHGWFERQAEREPERIAIRYADALMTYRELNERANRLARTLIAKGVGPDRRAAVMLRRSPRMMVAILAVLKAGGAYVPIAPELPAARIGYMLADSGAEWLLTDNEAGKAVPGSFRGERIDVDDPAVYHADGSDAVGNAGEEHLAYVIYTSGSTGQPKGVMIEHRAIMNRLFWMQSAYPLQADDVILQKTPFTFDVSVWELFWWFFAGASAAFLAPDGEKDPAAIVNAVSQNGVTVLHFVPSMLHAFLEHLERKPDHFERLSSLKRVFASGEALLPSQVNRFYRLFGRLSGSPSIGRQLVNLYGPTEAAVDVSHYACPPEPGNAPIPIGSPIGNMRLYIVNAADRMQPIGAAGELCISGIGLARGYLNRAELTREKFVPDPFRSGATIYRTGDLARWRSDGTIEYLGRMDHQVKIRGYRIECGEIETCLLAHPQVKEAVVTARPSADGSLALCAYLTAEGDLSLQALRMHATEKLPAYMLPAHWVRMDVMPLTTSGKLDRGALPAPDEAPAARELAGFEPPANETERQLAELWRELLGTDRFGMHDPFFEIGGHSLLVIRMHAAIDSWYPGVVGMTDLFVHTTIAKLARFIDEARSGGTFGMERLPLPQAFFNAAREMQPHSAFGGQMEEGVTERLRAFGSDNALRQDACLLALYVYLLAQVSKQLRIPVHVLHGEASVQGVIAELDGMQDYADIARSMHAELSAAAGVPSGRRNGGAAGHAWTQSGAAAMHEAAILFHYRLPGTAVPGAALRDRYDIRLELEPMGASLRYTFEFNARTIKREAVRKLAAGWVKLTGLVVPRQLEHAAAAEQSGREGRGERQWR